MACLQYYIPDMALGAERVYTISIDGGTPEVIWHSHITVEIHVSNCVLYITYIASYTKLCYQFLSFVVDSCVVL